MMPRGPIAEVRCPAPAAHINSLHGRSKRWLGIRVSPQNWRTIVVKKLEHGAAQSLTVRI